MTSESRAADAAAAVKTHAEETVRSVMQKLEVAQFELDEYRKEAMISMKACADLCLDEHHVHRRQQEQQVFISSAAGGLDSWAATADFVRSKLAGMKVRLMQSVRRRCECHSHHAQHEMHCEI